MVPSASPLSVPSDSASEEEAVEFFTVSRETDGFVFDFLPSTESGETPPAAAADSLCGCSAESNGFRRAFTSELETGVSASADSDGWKKKSTGRRPPALFRSAAPISALGVVDFRVLRAFSSDLEDPNELTVFCGASPLDADPAFGDLDTSAELLDAVVDFCREAVLAEVGVDFFVPVPEFPVFPRVALVEALPLWVLGFVPDRLSASLPELLVVRPFDFLEAPDVADAWVVGASLVSRETLPDGSPLPFGPDVLST